MRAWRRLTFFAGLLVECKRIVFVVISGRGESATYTQVLSAEVEKIHVGHGVRHRALVFEFDEAIALVS